MDLFILPAGEESVPLHEIDLAGRKPEAHLRAHASSRFRIFGFGEAEPNTPAALYVRSDAWFSIAAFGRLADRLAAVSVETGLMVSASGEPLAACLSAEQARLMTAANGVESAANRLRGLPRQLPDHVLVDAAELDPDFPPLRIANLIDVARIEKRVLLERAHACLHSGVRIRDPERISIRGELACGKQVEIDVDVIIEGQVTLGDGVRIGPGCILRNARVGPRSRINAFSIVDDAAVGEDSFVGPFARVRPGTTLGGRAQIGNFVEVKNALIGSGARINHLAFVGDAVLGDEVTLGAGVITCNHDGKKVNTTRIGDRAYVGSGSELIAPVSIGAGAFIAAGSTITENAPAGKLTIARARQLTVERGTDNGSEAESG